MVEVGPVERAKVLQLIEEIRVSANWSGAQADRLCEVISGEVRDLPAAPDPERDELREALSASDYLISALDAVAHGKVVRDLDEAWVHRNSAIARLAGKGVKG